MRKNKRKAAKALRTSLPIIMKLMCDPKFVKTVTKAGYKFDTVEIFKAFAKAGGWKFNKPFLRKRKVDVQPQKRKV